MHHDPSPSSNQIVNRLLAYGKLILFLVEFIIIIVITS